jgi:hypothetical protein
MLHFTQKLGADAQSHVFVGRVFRWLAAIGNQAYTGGATRWFLGTSSSVDHQTRDYDSCRDLPVA